MGPAFKRRLEYRYPYPRGQARPRSRDTPRLQCHSYGVLQGGHLDHLALLEVTRGLDEPLGADLSAIEAMGEVLAGTGNPFVGTSGTIPLAFGGVEGVGTEIDIPPAGPGIDAENAVIAFADRGIRSSVVRPPPLVHSQFDHTGYTPALISFARAKGKAGYPGDGSNRWPAVHSVDAARLYRLALEGAPAGTRLHAVGDEGVRLKEIAEAIGGNLGVPALSIPPEEIVDYFDFLTFFISLDNPASSTLTQELLDWHPTHSGIVDDLNEGH